MLTRVSPWWFARLVFVIGAFAATNAKAQDDDALRAALKVYAQGVMDEDSKRNEAALDEFLHVARVKETANVWFRIASCLDALGRIVEALNAYEKAVSLGDRDAAAADTVQLSRERAARLDQIVPRLTIVLGAMTPRETRVELDGVTASPERLQGPILLDPGHHSILASAPGASPFRTEVTLPESGQVTITIDLTPESREPAHNSDRRNTRSPALGAYVAFGVGGALATASVVAFALQAGNLETLHRDCLVVSDALACPQFRAKEVSSAHDAAQAEGPIGVGLALGSIASAGLGIWFLATHAHAGSTTQGSSPTIAPMVVRCGAGVALSGTLE